MVEAGVLGGHFQNQSNMSYKPLPQMGLKKQLSSYKLLASCFKREFNCQNPAVSIQLPNSQLPGTQTPANLITSLQTHTHKYKPSFFFLIQSGPWKSNVHTVYTKLKVNF